MATLRYAKMPYKNYFVTPKQIEFEWRKADGQKKVRLDVAGAIFEAGKTFEDYLAAAEHVQKKFPHKAVYDESFLEERSKRVELAKADKATSFNRWN